MDSVWIGKGMWNKVYKGEVQNNRDDSREVRKNKKNEKTELEKVIQIEKESKAPESEKEYKMSELEKGKVANELGGKETESK